MANIIRFIYKTENESSEFNTLEINGEYWFVANDVCALLGLQNSRQAVASLEEEEKLVYTMYTSGQGRSVNIVSESGLYNLIFKSRIPGARRFKRWVTKEVLPTIRKSGTYSLLQQKMPIFAIRYNENWHKIEHGYFSVLSELFLRLHCEFEKLGYIIPDYALNGKEMRPDVSVGLHFTKHLKDEHQDLQHLFKTYKHSFLNGKIVDAKQYKKDLLTIFAIFIDEIWIPKYAEIYFKERDPKALEYLPKLIGVTH